MDAVSPGSHRHLQFIAQPAHGGNFEAVLRLRESLPEPSDMHVKGSLVAVEVITSDVLDEIVPGKCPSRETRKLEQQLKLLHGDRLAVYAKSVTVNGKYADCHNL